MKHLRGPITGMTGRSAEVRQIADRNLGTVEGFAV
jgi:hypothetical protein